jgi:hypothetical protein
MKILQHILYYTNCKNKKQYINMSLIGMGTCKKRPEAHFEERTQEKVA